MKKWMKLHTLAALALFATPLCIACAPVEPAAVSMPAAKSTQEIDAYIEDMRAAWRVPGMAVAIVNREGVLYAKGFGTLEAGGSAPVDADTVFAIGSNGKSFTSVLMGTLHDEGVIGLDQTVVSALPGFAMADPAATSALTFTHALSHTSGLPEQSGLGAWYLLGADQQALVGSIANVELASAPGERFAYNNSMFAVAAQAAEQATGTSYHDLLRMRVYGPLGMARTSTQLEDLPASNVATPHGFSGGKPVALPFHPVRGAAAAGSVNASLNDMTRFVRMMLGEGEVDGARVLAPETAARLQTLSRPFAEGEMVDITGMLSAVDQGEKLGRFGYGLGLGVLEYDGASYAMHGGSIDGMTSWMMWSPEKNIGVIVLSNSGNIAVPALASFAALNPQIGLPMDRTLERMLPMLDQFVADPPMPPVDSSLAIAMTPDLLVGEYTNLLGGFRITLEDYVARLVFERTGYAGTVIPLGGDAYWVDLDNPALMDFGLTLKTEGEKLQLVETPLPYPALFPADPVFVRQ